MSYARAGLNKGLIQSNIVSPIEIDCNFIVDSTNGNGLGIRSLKSNGFIRNVFMNTSAAFTGTLNSTVNVTGISTGTATLVVGMPVQGTNIPAGATIASIVSSSAITLSISATGSATESITYQAFSDGYASPNPAAGYALIQMKGNYNTYLGGFSGYTATVSGSNISISGSSVMTKGNPYIVTGVGAVPGAHFTIAPVADVSGSLAGTYFTVSDAFSNNYVVWFQVSGVGAAPSLSGVLNGYTAVPVSIATGATAAQVGTALATVVAALNGSASFTATGTTTVTVTSKIVTVNLSPYPAAGTSGFTVSAVTYTPLAKDWQNVGLQPGLTPTLGQMFIATATGSALGSGTVKIPGVSQIVGVQLASGDPSASIANSSIAQNGGAWLLVQFVAATSATVPTLIATAPANNTTVGLNFRFDAGSVTVDGL